TVTVLYQAWIERIRPVLILNKIDRLITEWQMTAQEAYAHMQRLIEQVNAVLAGFWEEERLAKDSVLQQGTDAEQMKSAAMGGDQQDCLDDDSSIYFSPDQGNVLFASAFDGWAFGLSDFAKFYAPKLGIASPEKFCKALWGEFYFDPKNKKRILTRKQYAKTYGEGRAAAAQPLFVQLCLNNVWKVYDAILMHPDTDQVDKIIAALGVKILPRDRRSKDRRALLTAIMQGWLPLAQTCFLAAVEQLPSPIEAQARSLPALLHPESFVRFPHLSPDLPSVQPTDELERALYACDDGRDSGPRDGHPMPVVAFVSKMLAIERSSLPEFNVKSDRL
ncbi:Cytoplasmic GTPase/eEF2-like protein (ribosomal biogenesis), partial [Spiromyces aspiralis]